MDFQKVSKKLVSQNILINIIGNIIPMVFAVGTIPFVIASIGNERFGVLSIAWLFLGYFSILDLGMGRATTKFVLEYYAKGMIDEVKSLISTSVASLILFGIFIGLILFTFTPFIVEHFLNIPPYLQRETHLSFYAISASIPFVIGVAGVRGVLEAQQKFLLLNIIKIPASILNYVIPAVVVVFSDDLSLMILLLMITRAVLLLVYTYYCFRPFQGTRYMSKIDTFKVRKLVSYGGWLTVSNLVGPVMVYFDRFIIGSILTLTMLTYYSTPYEVITKLLVVAGSATGVLFPVFTNLFLKDREKLLDMYNKSLKGMLFILFPVTLLFACFSYEILNLWLNKEFAENSSVVLQLLSFGVLLNSLSAIPFTAIQALNRPDITAKVHVLELPFYIAALLLLAQYFGIVGVALAWMLRNLIDVTLFMMIFKRITLNHEKDHRGIFFYYVLFLSSCFLAAYLLTEHVNWPYKIPSYLLMIVTFLIVFWTRVLNLEERNILSRSLRKPHA